jgi:dienelactone hydrolase
MKKLVLFGLIAILFIFVGQALADPPAPYSEEVITGTTQGNHDLDCTVIRPWSSSSGPGGGQYPVIIWANGWNGGAPTGESTTAGYKPGLIEWALDGPYIVIAANQWAVNESDVLACLQWIVDQNTTSGSEYKGAVNTAKVGLAGHSQGGGAVIKAGDGEPNGFTITGVIAMSPYGPSWVDAGSQDGPVFFIGGTEDEVIPVSWFEDAWLAVQANDQGGVLAVLIGGDHSTDAWGPDGEDPTLYNFGRFQQVTELWWRFLLKDNVPAGRNLHRLLNKNPWITEYAFTGNFELP